MDALKFPMQISTMQCKKGLWSTLTTIQAKNLNFEHPANPPSQLYSSLSSWIFIDRISWIVPGLATPIVTAGKSSSTCTSHFSIWKSDYIFLQFFESSRHPAKHCYILKFSYIKEEFHDWGSTEENFHDWGSTGFWVLSLEEHSLWYLPHCSFYTRVNRRSREQWGYQLCFKGYHISVENIHKNVRYVE